MIIDAHLHVDELPALASGFPFFDPRLEVLRVRWAPNLDERVRAPVLGGNAERLLLS